MCFGLLACIIEYLVPLDLLEHVLSKKCEFFSFFLSPPALSRVLVIRFYGQRTYSLSSLTFKRVTHGSAIKTHFSSPLLPKVLVGATGHLDHTNNTKNTF